MEIQISDKYCIITPLSTKLNEHESERINNEISTLNDFKVGIDMEYVKDCTVDFIENISKYSNLSLFNVQSDIFSLLTFMNLDKHLNLFVSENDFITNSHRILNRKFSLV